MDEKPVCSFCGCTPSPDEPVMVANDDRTAAICGSCVFDMASQIMDIIDSANASLVTRH